MISTDSRLINIAPLTAALLAAGLVCQCASILYFHLNFDTAILHLVPDDAFYYLRIAQNISAGEGSVFSIGEPTNGYHPLWMAMLVLIHLATHPSPEQFVIYALLAAAVLNTGAAHAFARLLRTFGFSDAATAFAVVAYLFSPWLVNVTLTALETPLLLWLLFWFLRAAYELGSPDVPVTGRRVWSFGATAGFLMLARTDAIFFTAPAFLWLLWRRGRSVAGAVCLAGALASLVVLPWLMWSWM